ncbi:MAG: TonB-dependent receptor plug domain-containing protein [Limnobacter sp.]|nr:TonB-dependent receptor plug domain-containing protein [Limnobacter sp.]
MKPKVLSKSIQLLFLTLPTVAGAQQAANDTSVGQLNGVEVRARHIPVGSTDYPKQMTDTQTINHDRPVNTLPQVFEGQPGLIAEGVFGGIDHPRLSIRGSGIQRGTQPAGRGIEIREQGLPLGYADTSYDFVESIDPLAFDEVRVLRSGRAVAAGSSTLGGVVDFIRSPTSQEQNSSSIRYELGSFGLGTTQVQTQQLIGTTQAELTLTDYRKDGFRQHNKQEATRSVVRLQGNVPESSWAWRTSLSDLQSNLQLPGPQTLAQIAAGSNAAQPGNILGNWRRETQRTRLTGALEGNLPDGRLSINTAYQWADVQFMRRDEQDESNEDFTLGARYEPNQSPLYYELMFQHNQRDLQQYLNGGGVPANFTGIRGLQWADNSLSANRITLTTGVEKELNSEFDMTAALGANYHTREIQDHFRVSNLRPATTLDESYSQITGMTELRYKWSNTDTLFVGAHSAGEPPTYDTLLLNAAGMGMTGSALVNGSNPRRTTLANIQNQRQNTLEAGWRHLTEAAQVDFTLYYARLKGEIISTLNPVTQVITAVANADTTQRVGAELNLQGVLLKNVGMTGAQLNGTFNLNWVDAQFDQDPTFKDNTLPVITPITLYGALALRKSQDWSTEVFAQAVPRGAYLDYANTVRAGDYLTVGLRGQVKFGAWDFYAEARNLGDKRYVSTVIGAAVNAQGMDMAGFAPGEPQSLAVGARYTFN